MLTRIYGADAVNGWDTFEPLIRRVLKRADSGHFPDDILTCVQHGGMQLWSISGDRGIAVTEIQDYSRYRQLLVYMVAGKHARDWLAEGQQQLEAFAKSTGCQFMAFQGRPGWERYCAPLGYTNKMITMRKAVD
ncbi:MAG: hypothetical protein WC790_00410 [Candidatus Paceibacterota bacterium]|jgi:hypothetical protein